MPRVGKIRELETHFQVSISALIPSYLLPAKGYFSIPIPKPKHLVIKTVGAGTSLPLVSAMECKQWRFFGIWTHYLT